MPDPVILFWLWLALLGAILARFAIGQTDA